MYLGLKVALYMHLNLATTVTNESKNVISDSSEQCEAIVETQDQQHLRLDQRVVPEEGSYLTAPSTFVPQEGSVSETVFSHLDILKQPVKVAGGSWSVATARMVDVATIVLPDVLNAFPIIHQHLLQIYAYYKLTFKVEVVVNTTKFHAGKLMVWFDPMDVLTSSDDKIVNPQSISGQPHVTMDAGSSNSVTLDIPFEYLQTYFCSNSPSGKPPLGTVHVTVFNPLVVAGSGSSDPVPINVFVSAVNCDLHVPMRPHVLVFDANCGDLLDEESHEFEANILGGLFGSDNESKSSNGNGTMNLKQTVGAVKGIANTAMGAYADFKTGNFSGLLGRVKNFFSLDRPANPDAKQGNCLAVISPQAHMLGIDQPVRLGAAANGNYLVSDFSSAPVDDMLIGNYIRVPTLVDQLTWATTQAADTRIDYFAVCPGLSKYDLITDTGGNKFIKEYNTNLSYVSHFFEQWRGDITFTFEFAATQFHSGRLMFAFEPNVATTPLPGVDESCQAFSNNPHFIFDLREQKKCTFTIPYVSTTPRKRTVPGAWVNAEVINEDALGWLYILVLSPLVATENVSQSIEFNMYISAGENFAFYAPRIRHTTRLLGDFTPPTEFVMNSGEEGDVVSRKHESGPSLIKGGATTCPDFYNEPIFDFRDLTRRYSMDVNKKITLTPNGDAMIGSAQFGVHPDLSYTLTGYDTVSFSRYVSRIFTFWSGSMRFKFLPMVGNNRAIILRGTYVFGTADTTATDVVGQWSGYPQVTTITAQDKALEMEFPFYTPYPQLLTNKDSGFTGWRLYSPGYVNIDAFEHPTAGSTADTVLPFTIMTACGNDIAFRLPICAPVTWEDGTGVT